MSATLNHQAESATRTVTPSRRLGDAPIAERKRRQREEDKEPFYRTEDWRLFTGLARLPQKAGCQPADLGEVVLKVLADNALDAGAYVSLNHAVDRWVVCDDGPARAHGRDEIEAAAAQLR